MLRRTRFICVGAKHFFRTDGQPYQPYTIKSLFLFGFIASTAFLSVFTVKETKKAGPLELPDELEDERRRRNDPRRPPWPLLHQRSVLLREGKAPHDDLLLLWEQTRHYYPADWLVPLEITQVLKYTSGAYLQNYVPDPDQLRKEVLMQLLNIQYGRVRDPNGGRLNRDVKEIIAMAIEDLENMDLSPGTEPALVPTHT
ncbi:MIX protein [Trypanosoma equiperdum]|uniref:Mitochondrial membrane-anchored protein domain-containing protein n=2 Tax=Trypanozoon TaxID=39700 RepID=Q57ZY0_TRYB2|nr:hypothetical protein, conserved [Trypanosoma brucei brucei TREU927]AAX79345.1 hypothetical protein, conserved [Trypanosoma brucei]AAZ11417.1 hypothetical protein, conserved [Trypanosoma brucei brucei TREU927]SCU65089.1 MIX protein [Trypanosoma equiperdum]